MILQALSTSSWVQKEAAKLLGLSTRVLNYKIKQFGITHPTWKQNKSPVLLLSRRGSQHGMGISARAFRVRSGQLPFS